MFKRIGSTTTKKHALPTTQMQYTQSHVWKAIPCLPVDKSFCWLAVDRLLTALARCRQHEHVHVYAPTGCWIFWNLLHLIVLSSPMDVRPPKYQQSPPWLTYNESLIEIGLHTNNKLLSPFRFFSWLLPKSLFSTLPLENIDEVQRISEPPPGWSLSSYLLDSSSYWSSLRQ